VKLLAYLVVLGATASLFPQGTKPAALLFHLKFDGDAEAVRSVGSSSPVKSGNLVFGQGLSGKAVYLGKDSVLEYQTKGNFNQSRGTVMMYFKPSWSPAESLAGGDKSKWRGLFSQLRPAARLGSGAVWLWVHGPNLRGDTSDAADSYVQGPLLSSKDEWIHVAFAWDGNRKQMYVNGRPVGGSSDSYSPLDVKKNSQTNSGSFESFFVGCQEDREQAYGFVDEFKVFDAPLSAREVEAEAAVFAPLHLAIDRLYYMEGSPAKLAWTVKNRSDRAMKSVADFRIAKEDGATVKSFAGQKIDLPPMASGTFSGAIEGLSPGEYRLSTRVAAGQSAQELGGKFWVLAAANAYANKPGEANLKLIDAIDFSRALPPERFTSIGECTIRKLGERGYLAGGTRKYDRFAVRLTLPEANVPYMLEWDYPDDRVRTMEVIAQNALDPSSDYDLQTGAFCGDEYPLSGKMLTQRSVYWARSKDCAILFTGARENAPAAVSAVRVYELRGGLPDAGVRAAAPVNGWNRTIALYNEDCAISYDFGMKTGLMPDFGVTLDRLSAYMKWSGQNMLTYPAVWYQGRIEAEGYNPRGHAADFIRAILTKFEAEGLEFMPTINFHNIKVDAKYELTEKAFADGSLHSSPVMILKTGKPNPGGWHGTPPSFNPLHPDTRGEIDGYVDALLARYGDSPAFKGVILHLTKHTCPWFGSLDAGYNDYLIDAFEEESGVKVPCDRADPLRGKAYYEWLTANAREAWIDWRCRKLAEWYKGLSKRIRQRRPDLRLGLFSYNHTIVDMMKDDRSTQAGFSLLYNRESGFDPKYYVDDPSIIFAQTTYPADYRWAKDHHGYSTNLVGRGRLRLHDADVYSSMPSLPNVWVNMHDRYWESAVAGSKKFAGEANQALKTPWLNETTWRVSTLNPNLLHAMEPYLLPLRHGDVLGLSKGGFLIGTHGMEGPLASFSRAFRALPAVKFQDVPGKSETIRVRQRKHAGASWFYVANTGANAAKVSLAFTAATAAVQDLSTGSEIRVGSARLEVALAPYSLRSFSAAETAALKDFQ